MSEERSLVRTTGTMLNMSLGETLKLADIFARSGLFRDAPDAAKAVVKIIYGRELGIAPMQAMTGVHIIEGAPRPSAHLIAALIQRSGRYSYRVKQWDATACRIAFFENGEPLGESSFTMTEAHAITIKGRKLTDGDNWRNYPKSMLFARALTQGANVYAAGIFGGSVYAAEEMTEAINPETGEIVEGSYTEADAADPVDLPSTKEQQAAILAIFTERKWKLPQRALWLRDTCNVASVADLTETQAAYALTQLIAPAVETAPPPVEVIEEAAA